MMMCPSLMEILRMRWRLVVGIPAGLALGTRVPSRKFHCNGRKRCSTSETSLGLGTLLSPLYKRHLVFPLQSYIKHLCTSGSPVIRFCRHGPFSLFAFITPKQANSRSIRPDGIHASKEHCKGQFVPHVNNTKTRPRLPFKMLRARFEEAIGS